MYIISVTSANVGIAVWDSPTRTITALAGTAVKQLNFGEATLAAGIGVNFPSGSGNIYDLWLISATDATATGEYGWTNGVAFLKAITLGINASNDRRAIAVLASGPYIKNTAVGGTLTYAVTGLSYQA